MPCKTKVRPGRRIKTLGQLLRLIDSGEPSVWVAEIRRSQPCAFFHGMTLQTVRGMIERGTLFTAVRPKAKP